MSTDDSEPKETEEEKQPAPPSKGDDADKAVAIPNSISPLEDSILDTAPPEVRQVLESAPPQLRERVLSFFSMMMSHRGPLPDPVAAKFVEKFDREHISQVLESVKEDTQLGFRNALSVRRYGVLYLVLGLAFFVFLVHYLADLNPALLERLITAIVALICGLGGGYGYKAWRDGREQ